MKLNYVSILHLLLMNFIFGVDAIFVMPPPVLDLNKVNAQVFSKYAASFAPEHRFVNDRFYPLGYNSSRIAYLIEHDNDPADLFSVDLVVQDLIKDKIVYRNSFRIDDPDGKYRFGDYWQLKSELIINLLKKYGLEKKDIVFLPDRLRYIGDRYTFSSQSQKIFNRDYQTDFLLSSRIYLHSQNRGVKRINSKVWKNPSYVLARKPIGFLKLGKGKRVAILVATVTRGWEGPPHNLGYEVVGAHMTIGFITAPTKYLKL